MSEPRTQPAPAGPGSPPSAAPGAAPTMEEILTSIRRIIAESDNPPEPSSQSVETLGADPAPSPAAAASGNLSAPVLPSPFLPPPVLPSGKAGPAAGEALVLTRMLAEDGSVVSLDIGASAAEEPLLLTSPLPPAEAEPSPVMPLSDILQAADRAASAALASAELTAPEPPASEPPAQEPSAAVPPAPAAAALDSVPVEVPVEPLSPPLAPEPIAAAVPLWLPPADLMPPPAPPEERAVEDNPIREGGAEASATACEVISGTPAPRGELTIEALVREALEPRLQAWLNEHLEAIVERRVQQEIDRISRLAER